MNSKDEIKLCLNNEKYIKSFKMRSYIVAVVCILVVFVAFIIPTPIYFSLPVAVVICFVIFILSGHIFGSKALKILTHELDPIRYLHLVHTLNMTTPRRFEDIEVAICIGDFATAAALCKELFPKKKNTLFQFIYSFQLARCYFYTGDTVNLKNTCIEILKLPLSPAIKCKYLDTITYYINYADGKFESCMEIRDIHEQSRDIKRSTPLNDITILYMYAVACHKAGHVDDANIAFKQLASQNRELYISKSALDFLENRSSSVDAVADYNPESCNTGELPKFAPDKAFVLDKSKLVLLGLSLIVIALALVMLWFI